MTNPTPSTADDLIEELEQCPRGRAGWRNFEDVCVKILRYLFVPPLQPPRIQARSYSGIDRRDAVMANRNLIANGSNQIWNLLYNDPDVRAKIILFEFKNYEDGIGKDEVDQTRNYLTAPMGRLAFILSRCEPSEQAKIRANSIYTQEKEIAIFISDRELKEMIRIRERGDDPASFLMTAIEEFYIQHE